MAPKEPESALSSVALLGLAPLASSGGETPKRTFHVLRKPNILLASDRCPLQSRQVPCLRLDDIIELILSRFAAQDGERRYPKRKDDLEMTRNKLWTPLLLLPTLMPTASVAGQQPGDTVRVSGDVIAQFVRADTDGLHLSTGFVPYGDITSLELKVGSRSWWHVGALIGFGAGGGVGAVLASSIGGGDLGSDTAGAMLALGCVVGGVVVGGVAGARKRTAKYTSIPLPTPTLGLVEGREGHRGLALGVRWRF